MTESGPELSVVVPFFNEEGAVGALMSEIRTVLDAAELRRFELIAVNDGSADRTGAIIQEAALQDSRIRAIEFAVNRGQAAALLAGLRAARAPVIVTMDGDGQNDPADIPAFLRLLEENPAIDMVVGYRFPRNDSWLRRWMSRFANRIRSAVLHDGVRDSGCALKVMRSAVVEAFVPLQTLYSFMPALAVSAGHRVMEAPAHHRQRTSGTSNYGLRQFWWRPALDLLGVWWFGCRRIPPASMGRSPRA